MAGGAPIRCQDCVLANTPAGSSAQRPVNPSLEAAAAAQKPLIENGDAASSGIGVMTRERWQSLANELVVLGMLKQAPEIDFLVALARVPGEPLGDPRDVPWRSWHPKVGAAVVLGGGDAARCHDDGMTGGR
jgi:hypothetical protein